MRKVSAGLLLYRRSVAGLEVLLVHPGGPYWAKHDLGVWSIPKGEVEAGEDEMQAALREFVEETGFAVSGTALPLGRVTQRSGKIVTAWAMAGDADPGQLHSNEFEIEWPPRSGTLRRFPEVDRAGWFDLVEARRHIVPAQAFFLDALVSKLEAGPLVA
jgi:predicted NUDIX family NTP pyrophosphohydrolase